MFDLLVAVVGAGAAAIASIAGFGIGSLLTPAFALQTTTNVAVAAVSVPHLIGTALRFWSMRSSVDRRVVVTFGLTSAAGGLAGALLQRFADSPRLAIVFGLVLLFVAASELSGLARRMRFRGAIGLIVDGARMPVYLYSMGDEMLHLWRPIAIATCAVVVGTILGRRVLDRIPETQFRQIVAVLLALLGTAMLVKGLKHSGG